VRLKSWRALPVLILFLALPAAAAPPVPRGPEIQVNTNTLAYHYFPKVAVFPDGGFVVVWTAGPKFYETGRRVIHARLFDSKGKPTSGEFRLIDRVDGSQAPDQVVADRDGSFLVVWTELTPRGQSSVFVRRFNRNGAPRGEQIRVHGGGALNRYDGVVAVGSDGRFAVGWQTDVDVEDPGAYTNAMARIFAADGTPVTREILLSAGTPGIGDDNIFAFPTGLALAPDGTLSALVQYYALPNCLETHLVQRKPRGGLQSQSLNVGFNCVLSDYYGSSLAMSRDGSVIATWSEFQAIAQRFAPDGTPRGDRNAVDVQIYTSVAAQADGSFIIVWTDVEGPDGGLLSGIFGRAFAADGTPLTRDLRINTTTENYHYGSAIAAHRRGPVVVVWGQIAQEERADIFARVLSANP
jgi:sugar lactone lactonase YvrE